VLTASRGDRGQQQRRRGEGDADEVARQAGRWRPRAVAAQQGRGGGNVDGGGKDRRAEGVAASILSVAAASR
jgi:hypothetical protein